MSKTIADYPAYRIYEPYEGRKFRHGEKIALPFNTLSHGVQWHFFTLGSVEGFAIERGACPHEELARHLAFAAELKDGRVRYWANANAVCLHNGTYTKEEVPGFNFGDTIIFQGKSFTLHPDHNQNVKLVEA